MNVQPKEYLAEHPFLQMPAVIWNSDMSLYAKCLYMTLMNRGKLSEMNGFQDEKGTYVFCTVEQAAKELSCKRDKAMKTFRELEERGLLLRVRRSAMRSNYYYLRAMQEQSAEPKPPVKTVQPVPATTTDLFQPRNGCYTSFDMNELQVLLDRGAGCPKFDQSTGSTSESR